MKSHLQTLFAPYPDVLTTAQVIELVDGCLDEILCFLESRALPGVTVGGQWLVLKNDLLNFVVSGPSQLEPADDCACWPAICCDIRSEPTQSGTGRISQENTSL